MQVAQQYDHNSTLGCPAPGVFQQTSLIPTVTCFGLLWSQAVLLVVHGVTHGALNSMCLVATNLWYPGLLTLVALVGITLAEAGDSPRRIFSWFQNYFWQAGPSGDIFIQR